MTDFKNKIEKYKAFYVKGFIGLIESDILYIKKRDQFLYLELLKHMSEVTGESQQSLRESVSKTIKALIKGYKNKLF